MKIKKNKTAAKQTLPVEQTDRRNFFIVIGIILLVNLLLYFTAFPSLDDMAAANPKQNAASGAVFLKLIVIVVTDAFLFVTLSMILSRRNKR